MHKKLVAFVSLLIFYSQSLVAVCECDEFVPLNKQECSKYEVIFSGKVLEYTPCSEENAQVTFELQELYKGDYPSPLPVLLTCESAECIPDFIKGDEWLIFAHKNNAQEVLFDVCSRSRKLLPDSVTDYMSEMTGLSFFQEKAFLQQNFEPTTGSTQDLKPKKYEKVNPKLIPIFLGISLLFMVIGLWVMKYLKRKK